MMVEVDASIYNAGEACRAEISSQLLGPDDAVEPEGIKE